MQKIAVFGPSDPSEWISKEAVKIGRLIADIGWVVVNGGYGGVMEDVSRGARASNGEVIGITLKGIETKNAYLTEKREADFFERLQNLLKMPRIFFSPKGSIGSILEFVVSLNKAITEEDYPTILIIEESDNVFKLLKELLGEEHLKKIFVTNSSEKAIDRLKSYAG
ncbi:MAG: LOG family protein [bacterium]